MGNFKEIINQNKPVLVDFFATWCGPCKTMSPILADLKKELGEKVSIIKIDVDKNQQAANAYQVQGVPTLILFKNGHQNGGKSGVVMKAELLRVISPELNEV